MRLRYKALVVMKLLGTFNGALKHEIKRRKKNYVNIDMYHAFPMHDIIKKKWKNIIHIFVFYKYLIICLFRTSMIIHFFNTLIVVNNEIDII